MAYRNGTIFEYDGYWLEKRRGHWVITREKYGSMVAYADTLMNARLVVKRRNERGF